MTEENIVYYKMTHNFMDSICVREAIQYYDKNH